MLRSIPALAFAGLMAGCASYPAPVQRLADAQSTTTAAEQSGAAEVPQAELHLQYAKEEIEHARVLMKDKENERAAYMLVCAQADADLAYAEAHERNMRAAARKLQDEISALRTSGQPVPSSTTTTTGQEIKP